MLVMRCGTRILLDRVNATKPGQLGEHYIEFSHHLMLDAFDVGKVRALAQDRLGQIEAMAHAVEVR
jgi:hypothetical protein